MAVSSRNDFKQSYDQVEALNGKVEGVMKCAVGVAEDMQEEGEQYGGHVDKIEQYLLEFAKLAEDVNLRKQALDNVQSNASKVKEDEEPPDLSRVFLNCLDELQAARKVSYDPRTHPIVQNFSERVRNDEEEEEEEEEEGGGADTSDLVVRQVDKSLKCPLTKAYLEDPVTSKVCHHSYSRDAILTHIRQRHKTASGAKCPVCGKGISESDLVADKKLQKLVRKAKKQKPSSHDRTGVVRL